MRFLLNEAPATAAAALIADYLKWHKIVSLVLLKYVLLYYVL